MHNDVYVDYNTQVIEDLYMFAYFANFLLLYFVINLYVFIIVLISRIINFY